MVYYALSKLGAIVSPVPVQYRSHELEMMAGALGAGAMITLERFRQTDMAAAARQALPDFTFLSFGSELTIDTSDRGEQCLRAEENANRVLSICWICGTTGTPKGVPRSHNMWLATRRCSLAAGSYTGDDVLLNPFPMVNMAALGGFLFPSAILGCAIVLHHPLEGFFSITVLPNLNYRNVWKCSTSFRVTLWEKYSASLCNRACPIALRQR